MKVTNADPEQLEMTFARPNVCLAPERRLSRARKWFRRMRRIVDGATDWRPIPHGRPEQIWLAASGRRTEFTATSSEERHVCE
ncbi:MAG: hypothetical protein ACREIC_14625 [Limisphaerales bacterium]